MAGASFKFWKVFTNITNTKSVLTNKCLLPVHQSIACVKQSADKSPHLPEKPKRPMSAYLMFYQSIYPKLCDQHPGSHVRDLAKLAGEQWKICDPSVKSSYEEIFKKNWAAYESAKENFEAKLTPAMKKELIAAEEKVKKESTKRKQRKDQKELGKPKRPLTPWTLFLTSKSGSKGDQLFPDWVKKLAQEWYSIDNKSKAKELEEYKLALKKYQKDTEKWEEEMVRAGRADLVRAKSQTAPKKKRTAKKRSATSKSGKSKSANKTAETAKTEKADEN